MTKLISGKDYQLPHFPVTQ